MFIQTKYITAFLAASIFCVPMLFNSTFGQQQSSGTSLELIRGKGCVEIKSNGHLFTRYDYASHKKPIFFPLFGPEQLPMTRSFPMKKADGESDDHPHHKSMWVGHTINNVDFWTEQGSVVLKSMNIDQSQNSFAAVHNWVDSINNKIVAKDKVVAEFFVTDRHRIIDYQIQFHATRQPIEFADTKEGFFAIRVHPHLRVSTDVDRGVSQVYGTMRNANGETGKEIWGRKSTWVHCFGTINGQKCGIAVFDHPKNLRHPTNWHARDYGLVAANPFGLHFFENRPPGTGQILLAKGKSLTFRFRVLLHSGVIDENELAEHYTDFIRPSDPFDRQ